MAERKTAETSLETVFRRTQNIDTHTLIWLEKSTKNYPIQTEFRSIIDYIHLMDDVDLCTKYINESQ